MLSLFQLFSSILHDFLFHHPALSSGPVGHHDSARRTGLEDISCQWGEWHKHFLEYEYSPLSVLSVSDMTSQTSEQIK